MASYPRLSHRLTLEAPTRTPDGSGGYTQSWTALGTLWAELRPRTGRERTASGAPMSVQGYKITVRGAPVGHPERPQALQRFRDGARVFLIEAVAERDAEGRYLTCIAAEEVAT
ncbi:MAG: phage head closure protein [Pseudomonadota bacterium]